jgi:hypothetical protein
MSRFRVLVWEHKRGLTAGLLVALAITLAFGVGYLVGEQANPAPIVIEQHTN